MLDAGTQQSTTFSGGTVVITKVTDGVFRVSCTLGGWYAKRYPEVGDAMKAPGIILLKADNTIVNCGGIQQYWEDKSSDAGGSYYDPATQHVHLNTAYTIHTFICDMSK